MQLELAVRVDGAPDFGSDAQVAPKHVDLLERRVAEDGDDVVLDPDDEPRLVGALALHDLDVVARGKGFADRHRRHLEPFAFELRVGLLRRLDRDRLGADRVDRAVDALLVAFEHLDLVARLEDRRDLFRGLGDLPQVDLAGGLALAEEPGDLVDGRVDVLHLDAGDPDVLFDVAVAEEVALEHEAALGLADVLLLVRLADLFGVEVALRRPEGDPAAERAAALFALAAVRSDVHVLLLGVEVDAGQEAERDLVGVFEQVGDLGQVARVLAPADAHPTPADDRRLLLLGPEQVGHLLLRDHEHVGVEVHADETPRGLSDVGLRVAFDVDVASERVSVEGRDDAEPLAGHGQALSLAEDRVDEIPFAAGLRHRGQRRPGRHRHRRWKSHLDLDGPDVGVIRSG